MPSLPQIAEVAARALAMRLRRPPALDPAHDAGGPVDLVYLWADPSDPEWARRRREVLESEGATAFCEQNRQPGPPREPLHELRYSLRSAAQHLSGFDKVHLVVDRQLPGWLDRSHPRLRVVEVEELVRDPAHYPTYNTQAIESYFAGIPGLSERFVYLNDDFFFRRPVDAGGCFTAGGHPRVQLGRALAPTGEPGPQDEGDRAGGMNAGRALDLAFGRRRRLTVAHRPYPHRRSLFVDAERRFPEAFAATRAARFRAPGMYALHSFLLPYFAAAVGRARLLPPRLFEKDMFHWSGDASANARTAGRIRAHRGDAFCIQEARGVEITPAVAGAFHEFMESLYPRPSPFEKPDSTR